MAAKTIGRDLTKGNVTKQMITFAMPFMISNALQAVYSMVDMLVVGNVVGETGLSAVNNSSMLIMLMTTLCMGFSNSGQVYISQLMGAKKRSEINSAIGTLFSTVMIMAAIMTVISLLFSEGLLSLLDVQGGAFAEAKDYMLICGGGIVFTYGYNMVSSVLRGMGNSKMPLLFIAIASVINIILDLLFVKYMGMGVAGAAWATIIGQAASFIFAIVYLYGRREEFGFDFKLASLRIDGKVFRVLVRLGVPFAIQMSAISISMLFVNRLINTYGGLSCSAAFGVNSKITQIPDIIARSISMASASMIGQNLAAREIDRSKKVVHTGLWMCAVIYGVFAVAVLGFPQQLFGLFTSEANVLKYAWPCLLCAAISFPAHITMSPCNSFIQGIGDAKFSLIIAILDGVVARISLSYILGVVLGESFFGTVLGMGDMGTAFGFFLGFNLATYVTAIPAAVYFFAERWRKRTLLV